LSTKAHVLPPRRFKPAGVVEGVKYSPIPPPFIREKKRRGRRADGIRYEKRVHEYLTDLYGDFYIPSLWLLFQEVGRDRPRWCQPDGLLFLPYTGQITIVECKLQHTSDAYWQLKWLYLPVIAKAFPGTHWKFGLCEVVKWYDPATQFPEPVRLRASVSDVTPFEIGVHIWRP